MKVQKNTPFVPYKKENNRYAKYNRSHPTKAEQRMRDMVLKDRPLGYKFTRQKPLEAYVVDFYCAKLMLVIEIDGDSHIGKGEYDEIKESKLAEYGIAVKRYTNSQILGDISLIKDDLYQYMREREKLFV